MKRIVRFVLVMIFSGPGVLATKYGQTKAHRFWLSSFTNEIIIFDEKTDQEIKRLPVGPFPTALILDDHFAYIVNGESHSVSALNLATLELHPVRIAVGKLPSAIAIYKNKAYVTNGGSDTVSIINLERWEREGTPIRVGMNPQDIQIDGDRAFVVNNYSNTVSCLNLETHKVFATLRVGLGPLSMCVNENMGFVVNNLASTLSLIHLKNLNVLTQTIPLGKYPSHLLCFDQKAYVINCVSHSLSVIDLKEQLLIQSFSINPFPDDLYIKKSNIITDMSDVIPLFPSRTVLKTTTIKELIHLYNNKWPEMFAIETPPPLNPPQNPSEIERLHRLVQDELLDLMPPLDALRTLASYKYPIRYLKSDSGKLVHQKLRLDFLATIWLGKRDEAQSMLSLLKQLRDPLFSF